METPHETAARLLASLEALVEQEGMYLRGGYYDLAVEVRRRAAPLVQQLVVLAGDAALAAGFRPRVAVVQARSAGHAEFLQAKLGDFATDIRSTDQARLRAAQVAPAYIVSPRASAPRFLAAG